MPVADRPKSTVIGVQVVMPARFIMGARIVSYGSSPRVIHLVALKVSASLNHLQRGCMLWLLHGRTTRVTCNTNRQVVFQLAATTDLGGFKSSESSHSPILYCVT